ncbi:MAG: hypothetical protein ACLT0A_11540 [Holdemanella porci]|uniref:hypothetical protein n=1 Tax=Holdemanella TaxID=1573535 RepID=UPI003996AE2F
MKRTLVLTKDNSDYLLTLKDDVNATVHIRKNVINGEDIYNAFYKNIKDICNTDIETILAEQSDKIIKNQLEQLFKLIDYEINKNCFNDEEKNNNE